MFKRVIWMSTGMAVGAAGAFWAKRRVEETVERYLPEQVADRAAASARSLGQTVRAAASEGRDAMRATETELRNRVEDRTFVGAELRRREDSDTGRDPAARHRARPSSRRHNRR